MSGNCRQAQDKSKQDRPCVPTSDPNLMIPTLIASLATALTFGQANMIDVTSFGAKGDGKTDDTKAFQTALDSAASQHVQVYAPSGSYPFLGQINVPQGVTLKGTWESVPAHNGLRDIRISPLQHRPEWKGRPRISIPSRWRSIRRYRRDLPLLRIIRRQNGVVCRRLFDTKKVNGMKAFIFLSACVIVTGCSNPLSKLAAVEKKAVAQGVPLTIGDALRGIKRPSPEENAAADLKKALVRAMLPKKPGFFQFQQGYRPEIVKLNQAVADTQKDWFLGSAEPNYGELKKYLPIVRPILKDAMRALEKPGWDFNRPWGQGVATLLPDLARLKSLAKWMRAEATLAAHNGETQYANQILRSMYRFSEHIGTEPNLICLIVAESIDAIASRTALDFARIRPQDSAFLAETRKIVMTPRPAPDLRRIWNFEQALMLDSLEWLTTTEGLKQLGVKPGDVQLKSPRALALAKASLVKILIEARKALGENPNPQKLEEVSDKFQPRIEAIYQAYSPIYKQFAFSEEGQLYRAPMRSLTIGIARQRVTGMALLIVETQPLKGPWHMPAEASRPEWRDPFTDAPLKMTFTANGFKIYSVGFDGKDDKGSNEKKSGILPAEIGRAHV